MLEKIHYSLKKKFFKTIVSLIYFIYKSECLLMRAFAIEFGIFAADKE